MAAIIIILLIVGIIGMGFWEVNDCKCPTCVGDDKEN